MRNILCLFETFIKKAAVQADALSVQDISGFDLFAKQRCRKRNNLASSKKEPNVVQRYDTTLVIRVGSK